MSAVRARHRPPFPPLGGQWRFVPRPAMVSTGPGYKGRNHADDDRYGGAGCPDYRAGRPILRQAQDERAADSLRDDAAQETLRNASVAARAGRALAAPHPRCVRPVGAGLSEGSLVGVHRLRDRGALRRAAGRHGPRSRRRPLRLCENELPHYFLRGVQPYGAPPRRGGEARSGLGDCDAGAVALAGRLAFVLPGYRPRPRRPPRLLRHRFQGVRNRLGKGSPHGDVARLCRHRRRARRGDRGRHDAAPRETQRALAADDARARERTCVVIEGAGRTRGDPARRRAGILRRPRSSRAARPRRGRIRDDFRCLRRVDGAHRGDPAAGHRRGRARRDRGGLPTRRRLRSRGCIDGGDRLRRRAFASGSSAARRWSR